MSRFAEFIDSFRLNVNYTMFLLGSVYKASWDFPQMVVCFKSEMKKLILCHFCHLVDRALGNY